jgi:hypothetical protein
MSSQALRYRPGSCFGGQHGEVTGMATYGITGGLYMYVPWIRPVDLFCGSVLWICPVDLSCGSVLWICPGNSTITKILFCRRD